MPSSEIGFSELAGLARSQWKLVFGLGLATALVVLALALWTPTQFESSARLVVLPILDNPDHHRVDALYRALLESDEIINRLTGTMIREGHLPSGSSLVIGRDLSSQTVVGQGNRSSSWGIVLTATGPDPEASAAIVNSWARLFIEETGSILASGATDAETLLAQHLSPTRQSIEEVETARLGILDEFQERESETSSLWDRRIREARAKAEREAAAYRVETRRQIESVVMSAREADEESPLPGSEPFAAKLMELAGIRSELAKTPQLVELDKAVSDETLAELILTDRATDLFEGTMTSQSLNPLHDQLAVAALELESELRNLAGQAGATVLSALLARLEEVQLQRAAGLMGMQVGHRLRVQDLRRSRSSDLRNLARERSSRLAGTQRRLEQLADLESRLSSRLNASVVTGILDRMAFFRLAAPAVPSAVPGPRRLPVKAALGFVVGGVFGLLAALFRSTRGPAPSRAEQIQRGSDAVRGS